MNNQRLCNFLPENLDRDALCEFSHGKGVVQVGFEQPLRQGAVAVLQGSRVGNIEDEIAVFDGMGCDPITPRGDKFLNCLLLLSCVARMRHRMSKIEWIRLVRFHQAARDHFAFDDLVLKLLDRQIIEIPV